MGKRGYREAFFRAFQRPGLAAAEVRVHASLSYKARRNHYNHHQLESNSGWNVSVGAVTSNVIVALALIPAGALLFQEQITFTRAAGVLFCIVGLALVTR